MNEIAEKHFKYTAAKTCKIKSENQVKGKVKAKFRRMIQSGILNEMFILSKRKKNSDSKITPTGSKRT
jgi:hypothetical protein